MSASLSRSLKPFMALPTTLHGPTQRLSQVRRHLSTSLSFNREIRDAYILSASRTPTGKVHPTPPWLMLIDLMIRKLV